MTDVARRAGVDVSTVSRALNERTAGQLRAETVQRVMSAADELGYQPNVLARGLRTQRSHAVGMLVPDLTNPLFPPIVRGLEDALADAGYVLIVANTDNDPQRESRGLANLVRRQVDGLVLATSRLPGHDGTADGGAEGAATVGARPVAGNLPVVLVNRHGTDPSLPAVAPDDAGGTELVVDHLVKLGHRHVAHVAGPADTSTGRRRADAFRSAASAAGVFDPQLVEHAAIFGVTEGMHACQRLLARRPGLQAVFAASDLLAVGCLRALNAAGRRVPEDTSLAGFGDLPLIDLLDPPLTTVRIPQYAMGRYAGRLLLGMLEDPEAPRPSGTVTLPPELVVRRSTAPVD
ncbi:LacI family DNA-binding transcriptional regulator [Egicoccus sp. AB-alg2]|uniref:LacI family DNA-binding transcriptional regulator n=1 Tax=Egicoccus sp. AB-alg2 TaxID=3242693 RepID=UPI00359EA0FD